jgi:hypothetical protein
MESKDSLQRLILTWSDHQVHHTCGNLNYLISLLEKLSEADRPEEKRVKKENNRG